ncbi:HET-domain-containing protein [Lepidopterella palustris CBS 459.81]|uniref:HET-domain-containing protein n=1 Tax=Lepidopterella palustris CBS 459.81 TaxID=1314670 RepID=A0A8E2DY44_9PEZI|nr:HET-domain-containing protein [Lepidopterella palustris CBS 459.81]
MEVLPKSGHDSTLTCRSHRHPIEAFVDWFAKMATCSLQTIYKPLDQATREIRLAIIKPGAHDDRLRCELQTYPLQDQPDYLALSYTWGNPEKTHIMIINNIPIKVAKNLYEAFLRIRKIEKSVTIWADALCINQDCKLEKQHQVAMMADIYRGAREVVIWLGHPPGRHKFSSPEAERNLAQMGIEALSKIELLNPIHVPLTAVLQEHPNEQGSVSSLHSTSLALRPSRTEILQGSSNADETRERREQTIGNIIQHGLLSSGVRHLMSIEDTSQLLTTIKHWLVNQYFNQWLNQNGHLKDNFSIHTWNTDPGFQEWIQSIARYISKVHAHEDCILEHSIRPKNSKVRMDWSAEFCQSHISEFFEGAYEKAELEWDYDVIGAFTILSLLATGVHLHQFPFFVRSTTANPPWSSSVFWIHCVEALRSMLEVAYWNRTWIVQEVVLAQSTRFMYGRHSAPLQLVMQALERYKIHAKYCCRQYGQSCNNLVVKAWTSTVKGALGKVEELISISETVSAKQSELADFLSPQFSRRKVSNSVDRIYGVLGMICKGKGSSIVPDYHRSPVEVFTLATLAAIEDKGDLDILHEMEPTHARLEHPSWVFDWSKNTYEGSDDMDDRRMLRRFLNATDGRRAVYRNHKGALLEVESLYVDTVEEALDPLLYDTEQWDKCFVVKKWHEAAVARHIEIKRFWIPLFDGVFIDWQKGELNAVTAKDIPDLEQWMSWLNRALLSKAKRSPIDFNPLHDAHDFEHMLVMARVNKDIKPSRQLFFTTTGLLGVGYIGNGPIIRKGDEIHIVMGCRMPLLLRRDEATANCTPNIIDPSYRSQECGTKSGVGKVLPNSAPQQQEMPRHADYFRILCSCYIDGLMSGERVRDATVKGSAIFLV